jgi:hypothetical protein
VQGPAICDEEGFVTKQAEMNAALLSCLELVHEEPPNLFPPDASVSDYNVDCSFVGVLLIHQSPGYFDHVSEVIVIIFKTYFENHQNILISSSSMGFFPIKLIIIIISTFYVLFLSYSHYLCDNFQSILRNCFTTFFFNIIICTKISDVISTVKFIIIVISL